MNGDIADGHEQRRLGANLPTWRGRWPVDEGQELRGIQPVGPWLMPVQAEGDIHLRLRSWVSFPYLQEGDIVEIEVERLGRQRQEMVASSPDSGQG